MFHVTASWSGGKTVRDRRKRYDVADPLAIKKRQRIDKYQTGDPLTRRLCGSAQYHPPRTCPDHDHIAEILVKHQLRDFGCVVLRGDTDADLMLPFSAPVQCRGVDGMPGIAKPC